MRLMFNQCLECKLGISCYHDGFKKCPKIEAAGSGLGVPVNMNEPYSQFKNIPFSVYMSLKHMVNRSRKAIRSPIINSRR